MESELGIEMIDYKETREVEDFVSNLLNYNSIVEATRQLIELINQDEETNQPIKMITSQYGKDGWTVYAILANDKTFKYAMYIDEDGRMIADGF